MENNRLRLVFPGCQVGTLGLPKGGSGHPRFNSPGSCAPLKHQLAPTFDKVANSLAKTFGHAASRVVKFFSSDSKEGAI